MGSRSSKRTDPHSPIVPAERKEQVRRNRDRFPGDFMFELTLGEKPQVAANCGLIGNVKYSNVLPYAFTEHGTIMAASVLNTPRAVEMSVFVVRAFVRLRAFLATHKELAEKLAELERKLESHDDQIVAIIDAIKRLMAPPAPADKRRIGFRAKDGGPVE